jgi:hypothetical protein
MKLSALEEKGNDRKFSPFQRNFPQKQKKSEPLPTPCKAWNGTKTSHATVPLSTLIEDA